MTCPPRPWPQVVAKLDATGQAVWCVFWNTLVLGCFGCRISCRSWGNFGSCWWWGGRRNKTCKLEKFSVERSCWFSLPLALDVEELLDVTDQIRQQLVAEDHWEAQARTGQDWMTWRQGETANRAPGTRGSCRSGTSSAEVACYGHGRGGVSLERAWHWGYRGWIVFVEVRRWKKKKIKVVVLSRWRESCQLQLGNKCNIESFIIPSVNVYIYNAVRLQSFDGAGERKILYIHIMESCRLQYIQNMYRYDIRI